MTEVLWFFKLKKAGGTEEFLYPATGCSLSFDSNRDITRTLDNVILLPTERQKAEPGDRLELYLQQDGGARGLLYGHFYMSEEVERPDSLIDPDTGETASLYITSWADPAILLRSNSGRPETIFAGADPAQEMRRLIEQVGVPHSIDGSAFQLSSDISWEGSATRLAKISQLAVLAGHRPPWVSRGGVFTSMVRQVTDQEQIIDLEEDVQIVAESLTISTSYLTVPDRVRVTDSSGQGYGVTAEWKAPSWSPNSEARRGFSLTEDYHTQGIGTSDQAEAIARVVGESLSARKLACSLTLPFERLDGPVTLRYRDSLWQLSSWGTGTAVGETTSLEAVELFPPDLAGIDA